MCVLNIMHTRNELMRDMCARQRKVILYNEDYIVIDPGKTPLQKTQLLKEVEYREAQEQYGEDFIAGMGAEAIRKLLAEIDLTKLNKEQIGKRRVGKECKSRWTPDH